MRLPPDQIERFYAIWRPLILFANRKLGIEPEMLHAKVDGRWDPSKVFPIREALWANDAVREEFIAENPAKLSAADLAIVASWQHRLAGTFCVYRQLQKYTILIKDDTQDVYGVQGLVSTMAEVVPFLPCLVKAVLLPFEEQITYDGLLVPYYVVLGPGIRRDLAGNYKDAKEVGAIITSLLPRPEPNREEEVEEADGINARVVDAFRKHLLRSGLSPRVVERDAAAVAAFDEFLAGRPEPRSLRDFGQRELKGYLTHLRAANLKETEHKQNLTGLARLLRFLRDTGRMDLKTADAMLGTLKEKE